MSSKNTIKAERRLEKLVFYLEKRGSLRDRKLALFFRTLANVAVPAKVLLGVKVSDVEILDENQVVIWHGDGASCLASELYWKIRKAYRSKENEFLFKAEPRAKAGADEAIHPNSISRSLRRLSQALKFKSSLKVTDIRRLAVAWFVRSQDSVLSIEEISKALNVSSSLVRSVICEELKEVA